MQGMLQKRLVSSLFILCCSLILLPACYKKINKQNPYYYDEQPILKNEAHLTDIPLPVQITAHSISGSTQDSSALTFVSTFELVDLIKFYEFEMERLGWKELHLFSVTSEVLLIFEKPEKFCTVSIRPDNRVVIFFGTRS
ncbi:MAG: hypothetical protein K2X90_02270 [Candidatus Babeliaceae bacterium]|nr:hypothetical protein [Candidatus Babeliaceae bacterium]